MKNIIICDIDGTLCTDEHRNHILQEGRSSEHWFRYFDRCHLDPPVQAVIEVLQAFYNVTITSPEMKAYGLGEYEIHLMTARVDTVKQKTLDWLKKHSVPYDSIRFRPADCRLQDNVLKTKWADELGGPDRVLFVLEDRKRVVDAWRSAGYTCFQVAPGDF